MQRGEFSSRLAFIFAASGSAVGLGNIWGFPTNAAENGGAILSENIVTQNKDAFLKINLSVSIGAIVILGIIDLLIGILLLAKSTELPTLLKIFAIMSVIQGVLGITVVFAATLIFIFPITMIILAMFFLRKPESLEIV